LLKHFGYCLTKPCFLLPIPKIQTLTPAKVSKKGGILSANPHFWFLVGRYKVLKGIKMIYVVK
jgi:hypothetical protein